MKYQILGVILIILAVISLLLAVWMFISTEFPGFLPLGLEIDSSGLWLCTYLESSGSCRPIIDLTE